MKAIDLRVENQVRPLGLGEASPRFSWRYEGSPSNYVQGVYHIEVARSADFRMALWSSGLMSGAESHLVPYLGPPLEPGSRYWFRIRAGSSEAAISEWSDPSWFETALDPRFSEPGAWPFPFITAERLSDARSSAATSLEKTLELPFTPVSARVRATALGLYELTLNGEKVSEARLTPGWTAYGKRLAYQTYDVTGRLKRGVNVIAAMLGPGWYKGEMTWLKSRNLYGKRTAFSCQLEALGPGGEIFSASTDPSWEGRDSPLLFAEIYHGEIYDARLERKGALRPVSLLKLPEVAVVPQDGPPVLPHERFAARKIATPLGDFVLDFGQNLTGWVEFRVEGLPGERLVLSHAETLDASGNFYTKNLRRARNRVEYFLRGGPPELFSPRFSFQGFRYIRIEEWPGKDRGLEPSPKDFTAVVIRSSMEETLTFECSHPGLNQLHHNIAWGWKGNAVDIPTDCPQRDERLGWTGDAQIFAATASRLCRTDRFFLKWLRDLRADQRPDGGVPFVIPDVLSNNPKKEPMMESTHSSTGWADAAVMVPWEVYRASGDLRILEESWPSMKAWVEYIRARAEDGLLWNTGFHFGDWVALDAKEGSFFGATPNDLTATAYYARSTEILAETARILGKDAEARDYGALHKQIVGAFRAEFLTARGRLASRTQTAHILALAFGLAPEEHVARIIRDLLRLLDENDGHLTTGFLGTPAFCDALSGSGRLDRAYALLLKEDFPSWLYQVGKGATTVWEHWDGLKPDGRMWSAKMNSFNHYAYGAVGDWMYRTIGGIEQERDSAGYRRIVFKPRPGGGLTWARQELETPYGKAAMSWSIADGIWSLEFEVPPNASARLVLPSGETRWGSGSWSVEEEIPTAAVR
ncbi:MAG TPA: family 78 glycoside hydrolase catalytic domain [Rectinemataceae bacterium]|nr:family 78 glycoside hydrolase catalytic domain [Rectinemataceae bacterium]